MKFKSLAFSVLSVGILMSCGGETKEKGETKETSSETEEATTPVEGTAYVIDTEASLVKWHGSKKIIDGEHSGTVKLSEGELKIAENSIVGGTFTLDLTTIDTDEYADDAETKGKLIGHLKSGDFFAVDSIPTSTFVITGVTDNNVTGDLTIKGITKEISFPAEVSVTDSLVSANATFSIDRTEFGIQYGSNNFFKDLLDEYVINESIDFTVALQAKK